MNSCISPAAYEANNEANNIEIALDSCPQVMYNKTTDCFLQTSGCASAQRRGFYSETRVSHFNRQFLFVHIDIFI